MLGFIARRLAQVIPLLLVLTIIVFVLIHLAPYDVVDSYVTPSMSDEQVAAVRERLGLNEPVWVQYGAWLGNVLQGNLGNSLVNGLPIAGELATRVPNTILLVGPAYLTALVLAIVLGLLAGSRKGGALDRIIDSICSVGIATPTFWFALLVMFLFGYVLRMFPIFGMYTIGKEGNVGDLLLHMAMPYLVLVVAFFPDLTRYVRSSTITQLDEEYVQVQKAYGASRSFILTRHVSRNILLPIITQLGLAIPLLVTGAIVTESIFAWPGVGLYILSATSSLDFPVILAVLLLSAVLVLLGNLLADVLYVAADPRIRLAKKAA